MFSKIAPLLLPVVLFSVGSIAVGQELLQDPSFALTDVGAQSNPFWTLDVNFPGYRLWN